MKPNSVRIIAFFLSASLLGDPAAAIGLSLGSALVKTPHASHLFDQDALSTRALANYRKTFSAGWTTWLDRFGRHWKLAYESGEAAEPFQFDGDNHQAMAQDQTPLSGHQDHRTFRLRITGTAPLSGYVHDVVQFTLHTLDYAGDLAAEQVIDYFFPEMQDALERPQIALITFTVQDDPRPIPLGLLAWFPAGVHYLRLFIKNTFLLRAFPLDLVLPPGFRDDQLLVDFVSQLRDARVRVSPEHAILNTIVGQKDVPLPMLFPDEKRTDRLVRLAVLGAVAGSPFLPLAHFDAVRGALRQVRPELAHRLTQIASTYAEILNLSQSERIDSELENESDRDILKFAFSFQPWLAETEDVVDRTMAWSHLIRDMSLTQGIQELTPAVIRRGAQPEFPPSFLGVDVLQQVVEDFHYLFMGSRDVKPMDFAELKEPLRFAQEVFDALERRARGNLSLNSQDILERLVPSAMGRKPRRGLRLVSPGDNDRLEFIRRAKEITGLVPDKEGDGPGPSGTPIMQKIRWFGTGALLLAAMISGAWSGESQIVPVVIIGAILVGLLIPYTYSVLREYLASDTSWGYFERLIRDQPYGMKEALRQVWQDPEIRASHPKIERFKKGNEIIFRLTLEGTRTPQGAVVFEFHQSSRESPWQEPSWKRTAATVTYSISVDLPGILQRTFSPRSLPEVISQATNALQHAKAYLPGLRSKAAGQTTGPPADGGSRIWLIVVLLVAWMSSACSSTDNSSEMIAVGVLFIFISLLIERWIKSGNKRLHVTEWAPVSKRRQSELYAAA